MLNRVSRKTSSYYGYYRYESDPIYTVESTTADEDGNGRRKGLASMFSGNGKSVNGTMGEKAAS